MSKILICISVGLFVVFEPCTRHHVVEPVGPASPRLRELRSYVTSCFLHSTSRWVYQYPPFLLHPYRVESFRNIISCILIRLRTVFHFCSHGFYGREFSGGVIFFKKFSIYRAARTYRSDTNEMCASVVGF